MRDFNLIRKNYGVGRYLPGHFGALSYNKITHRGASGVLANQGQHRR
jgi:hypothetical protein